MENRDAGALTYSLPNIHGDTMATVNADGSVTGKYMTGSFGESLPVKPSQLSNGLPANTGNTTSAAYLGKHQKTTDEIVTPLEGGIIQMGARAYLPTLGRFLQVDPVEGGVDNNYVYPTQPVTGYDLTGKFKNMKYMSAPGASDTRWCMKNQRSCMKRNISAMTWVAPGGAAIRGGKILKNTIRIGKDRVAIGPAYTSYKKMNPTLRKVIPASAHFDRKYGAITCYWCGKKANGMYRKWTLWGK